MTTDTHQIEALEAQAADHKREIRRHRRQLGQTMTTLAQLKARCEAAGIEFGVATGDCEHGPRKETGARP